MYNTSKTPSLEFSSCGSKHLELLTDWLTDLTYPCLVSSMCLLLVTFKVTLSGQEVCPVYRDFLFDSGHLSSKFRLAISSLVYFPQSSHKSPSIESSTFIMLRSTAKCKTAEVTNCSVCECLIKFGSHRLKIRLIRQLLTCVPPGIMNPLGT